METKIKTGTKTGTKKLLLICKFDLTEVNLEFSILFEGSMPLFWKKIEVAESEFTRFSYKMC